ncbi:hypothetical protein B5F07_08470 [Lachnoclostridium sp. An169]|uniref:ABC transporter permease n=1 Tax=Lachnoclostridium sp. An169 TaxID=1965569 RepID=UPI000B36CF37|nr:ABC transporter permease [Lachnoclostridium sp. An169]OUP84161.1 hypothetical protein B5F07_08470 [Lachnoclostridium sp. An169]
MKGRNDDMIFNNNLKICHRLVRQDFHFHRAKNLILILAAALVTGLYTFVFLLGNAVENAFLLNYEYTYGSTSHILYHNLNEAEADLIRQNTNIRSSVRLSTLGQLTDPMIGQRSVKLAVTDRAYAQTVLSVPTTGRLPEKPGEIAMDEYTMDSLGIVYEEGTPVTLEWTDFSGQTHTTDFTLCGWWESPTNFTESCAWVTAETAESLAPGYNSEDSRNITLGVTLYQTDDLENVAGQILQEQGVESEKVTYSVSLAWMEARMEKASNQAKPFYSPAVLVLVCGFLMIYGIIHVAAEQDDRFFAGIKAQGMTPRQIRRFLWEKGLAVTLFGLVPGWLIGFLLNLAITGRIVTGMSEDPAIYFLSWEPFAIAAAATLITVVLAYLIPSVRLSRKNPASLLRAAVPGTPWRSRGTDEKPEGGKMTGMRLALRSVSRGKARTALSVVTMLLAVLLISSVWIQYISMKEDLYVDAMSPWDYTLADGSAYTTYQRYNENNKGITDETVEELRARPEVTEVSALKSHEVELTASEELQQRLVDYYNDSQPGSDMSRREEMSGQPGWTAGLERLEQTGTYIGLIVSIEGDYLDYLTENPDNFTSGSFDAEKFATGEYVITYGANAEGLSSLAAGETVTLEGQTFEVMASVKVDGMFLSGNNSPDSDFCLYYFVTPEIFEKMFPGQGVRQAAVNIDHSRQDSFEEYLDGYERSLSRGVAITRRSEYQEVFRNSRLNSLLPDLVVAIVLMGIALLNFLNMLVSKTISRRKEFAVYESLGMTREQLRLLLLKEGLLHGAVMAVFVGPLTVLFCMYVMPAVISNMRSWVSVYTFSLAPLVFVLLAVLVLSVAVPSACLHFVTRGSINERMHIME